MTFHREALGETQLAVLPALGTFAASRGFYLGGGTAVALHLGHRRSVDFDFMRQESIEHPEILAQEARQSRLHVEQIETARETLHAVIGGVRVSFLYYPYAALDQPAQWPEFSLTLASLDDLAAMKLAAVAQRGSRKDFIDVYAMAMKHKPIQAMIELYKRKYSVDDVTHLIVGLAYFDDAEDEHAPEMLSEIPWDEVKRQFRLWAKELAR